MSSSVRRSARFSTSAIALVNDQSMGSLAETRTCQRLRYTQRSGSPVKGKATELNLRRRSTLSSNASHP